MIITPPIPTTSLMHFSFRTLGERTFWTWESGKELNATSLVIHPICHSGGTHSKNIRNGRGDSSFVIRVYVSEFCRSIIPRLAEEPSYSSSSNVTYLIFLRYCVVRQNKQLAKDEVDGGIVMRPQGSGNSMWLAGPRYWYPINHHSITKSPQGPVDWGV